MDKVLEDIEFENNQLHNSLRDKDAEIQHLLDKISMLEKSREKEKKFHRKYAEEVSATEAIRIADFKKEKQSYQEEIKTLKKTNRQLGKDVAFYKKAHEELANNEPILVTTSNSPRKGPSRSSDSESQTVASSLRPKVGKQKSSKEVVKINLSLFEENKKLQSKICNINTALAVLKKKNKQLEDFRSKIENKKSKFCRDAEELERLIDLSKTKNKDKFTPRVLDMLGNLAKNKRI